MFLSNHVSRLKVFPHGVFFSFISSGIQRTRLPEKRGNRVLRRPFPPTLSRNHASSRTTHPSAFDILLVSWVLIPFMFVCLKYTAPLTACQHRMDTSFLIVFHRPSFASFPSSNPYRTSSSAWLCLVRRFFSYTSILLDRILPVRCFSSFEYHAVSPDCQPFVLCLTIQAQIRAPKIFNKTHPTNKSNR